mmetsp:Transcript_17926/g.36375  ORF Transcript_17926/g.36375 Transcript_17926/m.36375 type:complete len:226 (-) Transcript_17926:696-1373(-)
MVGVPLPDLLRALVEAGVHHVRAELHPSGVRHRLLELPELVVLELAPAHGDPSLFRFASRDGDALARLGLPGPLLSGGLVGQGGGGNDGSWGRDGGQDAATEGWPPLIFRTLLQGSLVDDVRVVAVVVVVAVLVHVAALVALGHGALAGRCRLAHANGEVFGGVGWNADGLHRLQIIGVLHLFKHGVRPAKVPRERVRKRGHRPECLERRHRLDVAPAALSLVEG